MILTPKIQKAINLASKLHLGQMRKSDPELPYISHLFSVAWILSNYTMDKLNLYLFFADSSGNVEEIDWKTLKKLRDEKHGEKYPI